MRYDGHLLPQGKCLKVVVLYFNIIMPLQNVQENNSLAIHITDIKIYSGSCLIQHTKGQMKCVGLHRMQEYLGFILVNRNTLGL